MISETKLFVRISLVVAVFLIGNVSSQELEVHSYSFYQQSEYPRDCQEVLNQCSLSNTSGVYLTKPDGYQDPFEVQCENDEVNGWTVILRRSNGLINFTRGWDEYESGFGFLSNEFFLGNKKLSYLTNQKRYQLRIDVTLGDGSSFYVTYDNFRITDAFSRYRIISTGKCNVVGDNITWCPPNMVFDTCSCQRTCANPDRCIDSCTEAESCICPSGFLMNDTDCVLRSECNCFIADAEDGQGILLNEGDSYVSPSCNKNCTCTSGRLVCDTNYQCSPNGRCSRSNNKWRCSCNTGYQGDGVECNPTPTDCQDAYNNGQRTSGLYNIKPDNWRSGEFQVYCNMGHGGGWTVFQRREDGSVNFYRNWNAYKNGFGSVNGEFWLGNDKLHYITTQRDYEIRIDMTDNAGGRYYKAYDLFRIDDESDKYRISAVGSPSGNAGDDSFSYLINKKFSTYDQDNDGFGSINCADKHRGGWWYSWYYWNYSNHCSRFYYDGAEYDYWTCAFSNLNGKYASTTNAQNIFWKGLSGNDCNIERTEMKIRPVRTRR